LAEQLACSTLKGSELQVDVHAKFPLEELDLNKIGMSSGILANTRNIKFHENAFGTSRVVTVRHMY